MPSGPARLYGSVSLLRMGKAIKVRIAVNLHSMFPTLRIENAPITSFPPPPCGFFDNQGKAPASGASRFSLAAYSDLAT